MLVCACVLVGGRGRTDWGCGRDEEHIRQHKSQHIYLCFNQYYATQENGITVNKALVQRLIKGLNSSSTNMEFLNGMYNMTQAHSRNNTH